MPKTTKTLDAIRTLLLESEWMTQKEISEEVGVCTQMVSKHLKTLIEKEKVVEEIQVIDKAVTKDYKTLKGYQYIWGMEAQ